MDNKENIGLQLGVQRGLDKILTNSNKINLRASNITSLVNDLDMEKQYLVKLKVQRQKTEKLHSQYIKLKKQKDKFKEEYEVDLLNMKSKLTDCQNQLTKKAEELKLVQRQSQKLKLEVDKLNRQKNEGMAGLKFNYQQSLLELKSNLETLNENLQAKNKQMNSLKKSHASKITDLQNQKIQLLESYKNNQIKLKQAQEKKKQFQKIASDLTRKLQDINGESNKTKAELQTKNKEIGTLKSTLQRTQLQYQTILRKYNQVQLKSGQISDKLIEKQRQGQKLRSKIQQLQEKVKKQRNQKQKLRQQSESLKLQTNSLKSDLAKKQETIKQYSAKLLRKQDEQLWRQRLAEKQSENQELLDIIRSLKEQNDSLMSFIKQKQMLQRQRRSLVEYEMEQISKFQNLLKDVK